MTHEERAKQLCTIGEHDGFMCLFIGGLPMYHAASIEQIGHQMDRLLPIITGVLASASQEIRHEQNAMYLDLIRKLDAKDAQLQAAQAVWTTARPTKAGWYWWRFDCTTHGDMVHIMVCADGGLAEISGNGHMLANCKFGGEWAGPISPPTTPGASNE